MPEPTTALPRRRDDESGVCWWTHGAQKGVSQPPYVVRFKSRWYRTLPLNAVAIDSIEPPLSMSERGRELVASAPVLSYGVRKCLDYLNRTNKQFRDLPLITDEQLQKLVEEAAAKGGL